MNEFMNVEADSDQLPDTLAIQSLISSLLIVLHEAHAVASQFI